MEKTFACAPRTAILVAIQWRMVRTYSWVHAAYGDPTSYQAPRRTLCGKRPYDPSLVASGPDAAAMVTCGSCRRVLAAQEV